MKGIDLVCKEGWWHESWWYRSWIVLLSV